jgi:hypothetical protein
MSAPDDMLNDILHSHANWAHQWPSHDTGTYIYGNGKQVDTEEAKAAIRAAIQSALPEKYPEIGVAQTQIIYARGYNAAISEIEANLKKKGLL